MGLSTSLSNALSGMSVSQNALEIVSRNVSNAGTPGYHQQSLSVIDTLGVNSIYARTGGVQRAFDTSLQASYTSATSNASYAATQLDTLNRLQTYVGQPGNTGSLDSVYGSFESAMQALSTSPDDYSTRATAVSSAQALSSTLNSLSQNIQGLRQDTETQMASQVTTLNQSLSSLADVNAQLAGGGGNDSERAALEDQRDRLVSQVSEIVDVRVDYRSDDTVALSTRTGISILDAKPSTFSFQPAGTLTADKQFNVDPSKSGVGTLTLTTPSGSTIDLVQQNVLQSGSLAALVNLRDTTLVNAQSQLDSVAAGVAQSFSTVQTAGTAVTSGAKGGYSADLSSIRDGNDFVLNYTQGGAQKSLRVVRVDDSSKLPLDYTDANGARVIGMSFAGGASGIATALSNVLGSGFTVSGSGSTLTVLDDGAASTTDVGSLTTDATVTGLQTGNSAFSLFTDSGNADFTNALDGKGQATGFASRIQVNSAILNNNNLLVQYDPTSSVGDPTRVNAVLNQLQTMSFASPQTATGAPAAFRVGGTVSDMISQTMNNVGSVAQSASTDNDTQQMTLDSVNQRLSSEYGVNVDDEMARLIQLQNAYAANARIISTVQDLMGRLLDL